MNDVNREVATLIMGWTVQDSLKLYWYEPAMLITDFDPMHQIEHAMMALEKMELLQDRKVGTDLYL